MSSYAQEMFTKQTGSSASASGTSSAQSASTSATSSGSASALARSSMFGSSPPSSSGSQPTSSLFGAPSTSTSFGGSFGASSTPSGFGGSFGASSTPSGFGGSFGAPSTSTSFGGSFGASSTSTNRSPSTGFGNNPPTGPSTTSFSFVRTSASPSPSGLSFGPAPPASASTSSPSGFSFGPAPPASVTLPSSSDFSFGHQPPSVERLFDRSDMFPDAIVSYRGQDIHIHRAIVAMGSPKLKSIFTETEEPSKRDGLSVYSIDELIKEDLQFSDVSRLVQYCYTGSFTADLPANRFIQIALVAEEFGMTSLSLECQNLCSGRLKQEPAVETLLTVMADAHKHGLVQLKKTCMTALMEMPATNRFKPSDLTVLDKDLLTEFLIHVTGALNGRFSH